jgi:hypothetical protein
MKSLVLGILAVIAILWTVVAAADAAPAAVIAGPVGPYEGSFRGVARGDGGTSALLTLDLIHRGDQVEGDVLLSEGLYVDGGFCGTVVVPATKLHMEGQTEARNPKRLIASPTFDAGGFDLTVDFESNVSADGDTISAEAKVDLPWFCGRDPAFSGAVYRN